MNLRSVCQNLRHGSGSSVSLWGKPKIPSWSLGELPTKPRAVQISLCLAMGFPYTGKCIELCYYLLTNIWNCQRIKYRDDFFVVLHFCKVYANNPIPIAIMSIIGFLTAVTYLGKLDYWLKGNLNLIWIMW